jgi:SAM-dependent methyltransferase
MAGFDAGWGRRVIEDELPPEWCPQIYRSHHRDLRTLGAEQLRQHYDSFGRNEGRCASAVHDRESFLGIIPAAGLALEIGPFARPLLRGPDVRYFDVLDRAGLRRRAQLIGYPSETVPEIDFVSPEGDLSVIDTRFAVCVSSHCIEHQPDLVRHLRQVASLLQPRGRYFLIVPDKRFCFDHFVSLSTVADVLQAHYEQRRRHTLKSVIEHRAHVTHNDAGRHWRGDHGVPRWQADLNHLRAAIQEFESAGAGYIDVHAWTFTPKTFKDIVRTLAALDLIDLSVERVYPTTRNSIEFFAVLRKELRHDVSQPKDQE